MEYATFDSNKKSTGQNWQLVFINCRIVTLCVVLSKRMRTSKHHKLLR